MIEALRGVRVDRIAAGEIHSCAASKSGGVYTWGSGNGGQLGHGNGADETRPTRVEATWGMSSLGLWAGPEHTIVLIGERTLLAFGCGVAAAIPARPMQGEQGAETETSQQVFDNNDDHYQMVPEDIGGLVRMKLP
jgi:alpha-tubulin suppressor-like RCC1 family protein